MFKILLIRTIVQVAEIAGAFWIRPCRVCVLPNHAGRHMSLFTLRCDTGAYAKSGQRRANLAFYFSIQGSHWGLAVSSINRRGSIGEGSATAGVEDSRDGRCQEKEGNRSFEHLENLICDLPRPQTILGCLLHVKSKLRKNRCFVV